MLKYRSGKIKKQHHVLSAAIGLLEQIAAFPEVDSITPGVIKPKKGGSTGLSLQYRTESGLRLIARSGGAAQEVFVVTSLGEEVIRKMQAEGLIPLKQ